MDDVIKKNKSIAQERRVVCYPPPKYHTLLDGYISSNEMKRSEALTEIMRNFFDKMPEAQKARCMNEGIKINKSKHSY